MLLDPFEKQLHLPAALVERADGCRWQRKVVGQEHQRLAGFRVFEADAAQRLRVILLGVNPIQRNRLIADDADAPIRLRRIHSVRIEIRLGAGDEESSRQMQAMQAREIDIGPIHDVDRTGLWNQQVERANIVHLAIGNVNEAGDAPAQIQQRMHLHRRLGRSEMRPWKHRQTQVDGSRVQRVHHIAQIQPQVFLGVKHSGLSDQPLGEFLVDTPVAPLVGIGQRRTGYGVADAHVIELGRLRRQAGFDVAQTLAIGELSKSQNAEVFGARQGSDAVVAAIAGDDAMKGLPWQEVHDLGEQRFANVHRSLRQQSCETARSRGLRSSRRHP